MPTEWYYTRQGQRHGPVTLEALQQLRQSGEVDGHEHAWHVGMSGWESVQQISELQVAGEAPAPAALGYRSLPASGEVMLTARAMEMLRLTRPWVRIVSIVMFVLAGLMAVGGAILALVSVSGRARGMAPVGLVYVAMACLYIAPAVYLFRYGANISQLLLHRRDEQLEMALQSQKSFWKFVGVAMVIVIGLYLLIAVVALLVAGLA